MMQDLTLVIFVTIVMVAWLWVKDQENNDE